ncbi:MAG: KTSC domain-containing protein [Armatimonadota bacterium]
MDRDSVKSSNIKSIGYDATMRILEVEFHSGSIYQYSNVPSSIHVALMSASSCGRYFQQNVRNCFKYKQVK